MIRGGDFSHSAASSEDSPSRLDKIIYGTQLKKNLHAACMHDVQGSFLKANRPSSIFNSELQVRTGEPANPYFCMVEK